MASIHKRGNFWAIKYYNNGKQFWLKTNLESNDDNYSTAKKKMEESFASDLIAKKTIRNHQRKIAKKTKARSINGQKKISFIADEFLKSKTIKSVNDYYRCLTYLISSTNDKYIDKLTYNDMLKLYFELLNGDRTPNSVSAIFSVIRAFINNVINNASIPDYSNLKSIILNLNNFTRKISHKRPIISDLELQLIMNFLQLDDEPNTSLAFTHLALNTGARLSDCLQGEIIKEKNVHIWKYIDNYGIKKKHMLDLALTRSWMTLQEKIKNQSHISPPSLSAKQITLSISKKFTRACRKTKLYTTPVFLTGVALKPMDVFYLSNTKVDKLSRKCLLFVYANSHKKSVKNLEKWEKAVAMTNIWSFQSLRYTFLEVQKKKGATRTSEILS